MSTSASTAAEIPLDSQPERARELLTRVRGRTILENRVAELEQLENRQSPRRWATQVGFLALLSVIGLGQFGLVQFALFNGSRAFDSPYPWGLMLVGLVSFVAGYSGVLILCFQRSARRRERVLLEALLHVERRELDA